MIPPTAPKGRIENMKNRRLICFLAALVLALSCLASASALSSSTLSIGSRGEEVRKLQQALIDLGYLQGKADGIFGKQTYQAVCNFQTARKLTVDGLAGKKTQSVLYDAASSAKADSTEKTDTSAASSTSSSSAASTSSASSGSVSSGNLFSGNYATLRLSDRGDRVKIMQQALIRLNYLSGKADGIFGNKTLDAVVAFQKAYSLTADGLAGKKTLKALESADKDGTKKGTASTPVSIEEESAPAKTSETSSSESPSSSITGAGKNGSTIQLLHWFKDIKPNLGGGQRLLIYDPSTGISWTLRVHSCGRHCDAEPLTAEDTANMLKAFGGENTWSQKGVYVQLPSGVWTVGSTHDMPHMTGTISDNNFNGHLCVHFLRDMSETKQNDPKYGVSNQETIRALWKSLTGETLTN